MKKAAVTAIALLGRILASASHGTPVPRMQRADPLLVFLEPGDARDTVGVLVYQANPLERLGAIEARLAAPADPTAAPAAWASFRALLPIPDGRGGYHVYGTVHRKAEKDYRWTLYRAHTPDGLRLDEFRAIFESPEGRDWLIESAMARRGDTGEYLLFTWARSRQTQWTGHALYGFRSPDGREWEPLCPEPLYHDHDAFGVMWDARTGRLITQQVTYQAWNKPYADNLGGQRRRVLSIRTSHDGRAWGRVPEAGQDGLIIPDARDPPDIEFYRAFAFPYGDRYVAMADLYAASPLSPGAHGPHLMCEWWVSPDAVHWVRPWRELSAQGQAGYPVTMEPMWIAGRMRWWIGGAVWGLPEYRVASVGARSNAEFTSKPFRMPRGGLVLNATIAEGNGLFRQGYIMAELLGADGKVVPGFGRGDCVLRSGDGAALPLRWNDRTGSEMVGQEVAIRFHLRQARIYALAEAGIEAAIHSPAGGSPSGAKESPGAAGPAFSEE